MIVAMYIEAVPNRSSPPAILLRESYRQDGKVKKRTLANLSKLPPQVIEGLRTLLRGGVAIEDLSETVEVLETWPWGHVGAVLGTARKLGLEALLSRKPCPERDRVMAMVVARVLDPASKLATARSLGEEAHLVALRAELGLDGVGAEQLYSALDWLYVRQEAIEKRLARRHLEDGSLVLYDVTSSYFEGRACPLAAYGYPRDGKKGKLQVVFGLLCNREGCPVAVEVFEGDTGDPTTLKPQLDKLRNRFHLDRVIFVGDRGLLTSARIREDLQGRDGVDWISALRTTDIRKLEALPGLQLSLFDERGFVELTDPAFPGERLVVCRNPLMAEERARKLEELLAATESKLDEIVRATRRPKRPLRGRDKIGLRVGRVVNDHKVAKHFVLDITETSFTYHRDEEKIAAEAALDGIYVVRTSLPETAMSAEEVVGSYKGLSAVERAFRSFKTVDLHVRPIHHYLPERVRAHVFLCMLAYYVEWHLRRRLAPLLFDDEDRDEAEAQRDSVVAPAKISPSAQSKARTRRTADGLPLHSFHTLLQALARLSKSRIQIRIADSEPIEKLSRPNALQQKAFSLLGLHL
jgi:transposase